MTDAISKCDECGVLVSNNQLVICSECEDFICDNCAEACDCVDPACSSCYVCLTHLITCTCPDQCKDPHYCGCYCPDCYYSNYDNHIGKCEECEECGELKHEECDHEWHSPALNIEGGSYMSPEPQGSQPRREMTSEERSRGQLQAIEDDGDEIEDIDLEGDNEEEDEE